MTEVYMIWSFEHGAWWGPNSNGFTRIPMDAGQYSRSDAYKICARRNYRGIYEVPVPVSFFDYQEGLHAELGVK